jgi:hypothetical protein
MLRRVALLRIDVSEEPSASIINVTRILELRSVRRLLDTANVPSLPILVTLMMEAVGKSDTSVLARATQHKIPPEMTAFLTVVNNRVFKKNL